MVHTVKSDLKADDWNQEYLKLIETIESLRSKSDEVPKQQLKNYFLLRLISFYERFIHAKLINAIDDLPKESIYQIIGKSVTINSTDLINLENLTIGKLAVLNLDNGPKNLGDMIIKILKAKYDRHNFSQINEKFLFFNFLDQIIKFDNTELKRMYTRDGNWYKIIQKLNRERNSLTHELKNTEMPSEEIYVLFNLYQRFFQLFTFALELLLSIKDEKIQDSEKIKIYESLRDDSYELKPFDEIKKILERDLFLKN